MLSVETVTDDEDNNSGTISTQQTNACVETVTDDEDNNATHAATNELALTNPARLQEARLSPSVAFGILSYLDFGERGHTQ
jgi:hypothetical protein